jgi:hypothetical protein
VRDYQRNTKYQFYNLCFGDSNPRSVELIATTLTITHLVLADCYFGDLAL